MKRFYENVTVSETPEGFRFLLDGKPVAKNASFTLAPWDLAIIEE